MSHGGWTERSAFAYRIYQPSTVPLPSLYRPSTIPLPSLYRPSTIPLPSSTIYHPSTIPLPLYRPYTIPLPPSTVPLPSLYRPLCPRILYHKYIETNYTQISADVQLSQFPHIQLVPHSMAFTDHSFQKTWYTFTSSNKDTQRFVAALKHTMWNINSALPISQVALGLPCLNLLTGVDSKPKFFIYAST